MQLWQELHHWFPHLWFGISTLWLVYIILLCGWIVLQKREAAATLSWQPVPEAVGYRVQVSRDAAFKGLLIERDSPATSVDTGLPPGAYFWRVASLRGNGQPGPWGDARAVAVRRVPGPVWRPEQPGWRAGPVSGRTAPGRRGRGRWRGPRGAG